MIYWFLRFIPEYTILENLRTEGFVPILWSSSLSSGHYTSSMSMRANSDCLGIVVENFGLFVSGSSTSAFG